MGNQKPGKEHKLAEKIVVTSQYLLEKQGEWTALLSQVKESFLAAVMDTEKLHQHFWGNPVRALQKEFISLGKEGIEVFRRLDAHIEKLGEIADNYEKAERSNVDVAAND